MTPAQLDHLRRIDAHLANLLATAEKRTPGKWQAATETVWTKHERICGDAETDDAAFIAACAGNAEAGWRATRAAIEFLLLQDIITRPTQWTVLRKALDEAFASLQSSVQDVPADNETSTL